VPALMPRSLRRSDAYTRKIRLPRTTPALASDSAATRMLAPGGIVTRTFAPPPQAAASASSAPAASDAARVRRRLRSTLCKRMLQENGRGKRVDVFLSAARRAAHLANGAERDGGRVSFIDQLDGKPRALRQLGGHGARLRGARRLVAVAVERQAHHEPARSAEA